MLIFQDDFPRLLLTLFCSMRRPQAGINICCAAPYQKRMQSWQHNTSKERKDETFFQLLIV